MAPKWIHFEHAGWSESGRTQMWHVCANEGGFLLGEVRWYGAWRCYGFYPERETVFERQCLRDIAAFCEKVTQEHRALAVERKR